jgi:adenylate cyclase class 2
MLEVEMKFPAADLAAVGRALQALGARHLLIREEVDQYFNAPDRDFAKTDEAVRIRQVDGTGRLTYKGPKLDAQTKTRHEVEVPLRPGPDAVAAAREFLQGLGYKPVAAVRKVRTIYHLDWAGFTAEASLDEVLGVGTFVELEILAPPERLEPAKQAVQALAAKLGLTNSERRSYLELWLEKHHGA